MRRVLFAGVLALALGSWTALCADTRGPITILGNGDFTKENGVVAGAGTEEDPYVIGNWNIVVPTGAVYGIKVENVTARFKLIGISIDGATATEGAAIHLGFVSHATIEGCTVSNSANGIDLSFCTDCTLRQNVMYVSGLGLEVSGESADEYRHAIDESNEVNNNPIRYLYGREGETVSGIKSNNLFVVASRNMTISDNEIICGDGIQLAFVTDSSVTGNKVYRASATPTDHGISLYQCSRNTVSDNQAWNNRHSGIFLWLSSQNQVSANQLTANDTGISLVASEDNVLSGNAIAMTPTGIELSAGSTGNLIEKSIITDDLKEGKAQYARYGISVEASSNNRLEANAIANVEIAVSLGTQGNDNTILANTIVGGSGYGIMVGGSRNEIAQNLVAQKSQGILFSEAFGKSKQTGNVVHDNVFADNGRHLYLGHDADANQLYRNALLGAGSTLVSDYGTDAWTVSGTGNYWGNYEGTDQNGDGIGDSSILVPAGAYDTAPLMSAAFAAGDMGVLSRLAKSDLSLRTGGGKALTIPALVANEGYSRFVGFRGFPAVLLPGFPGILFVFDQDVDSQFTMDTVQVALDIAFFTSDGTFAGGTTMEVGSTKLYTARNPFRYALELPSGTLKAQGIGEGSHLTVPVGK